MNKIFVQRLLRSLLTSAAALFVVFALLFVGSMALFLRYTPNCTHGYNRAVVALPETGWDIITVDDSCEVVTRVVAENKLTRERQALVDFLTMEDAKVTIKDGNIVVEVENLGNISAHQDTFEAHKIVLDATR